MGIEHARTIWGGAPGSRSRVRRHWIGFRMADRSSWQGAYRGMKIGRNRVARFESDRDPVRAQKNNELL